MVTKFSVLHNWSLKLEVTKRYLIQIKDLLPIQKKCSYYTYYIRSLPAKYFVKCCCVLERVAFKRETNCD